MVVRLDKQGLLDNQHNRENPIGVEGDAAVASGKVLESEKILITTKQKLAESGTPPVGVSASNSGRGYDPGSHEEGSDFIPTIIEGTVEEEPNAISESEASKPAASGSTTGKQDSTASTSS